MPVKRKALRIKKAFKSATRRGSGRDAFSPVIGEHPIVLVRLQVVGCKNLLAKDRNGFSDPFVVASILNSRYQTPVCKKTVQPTYAAKDATFDFPIYLSLADKLGVLELVVWDKDMLLKKDYLGEVSLPLDDWFSNGRPYAFNDNRPFSLNLVSTREGTEATGSVQIKLGFVTPPNTHSLLEFAEIFNELLKRSRPSLVSAPPTEGVGTIRSHAGGPQEEAVDFEDDGGISSDEEPSDEEEIDQNTPIALSSTPTAATARTAGTPSTLHTIYSPPQEHQRPHIYPSASAPDTPIPGYAEEMATPPTSATKPPLSVTPASPLTPTLLRNRSERSSSPGFSMSRMRFRRSLSSGIVPGGTGSPGTPTDAPATPSSGVKTPTTPQTPGTSTKRRFRRSWSTSAEPGSAPASATSFRKERKKKPYSFNSGNDIVGIVMLEIKGASDLPRLRNMTRTGWDMDPFVVISFGKKVFRTRVIRHTLNPVWDERLLFHVRRYELGFKIQLTLLDWDKLSSNDYIGDSSLDVSELLVDSVQADPETGLYPCLTESQSQGGNGKEFTLPITTSKEVPWEARHNPTLTLRARYQPYAALRQQFWRTYLKAYDTDDTSTLSHLEITSMLDSLGSTLRASTVDEFFTRFGKIPHKDELTIEEAIICLEDEMGKPQSERRRVDEEAAPDTPSVAATPLLAMSDNKGREVRLELGELDFSGPRLSEELFGEGYGMEPNQRPVTEGLSDVSASSSPTSSSADESDVPNRGAGRPQGSSETSELDEDPSLFTLPSSTPTVNNGDDPQLPATKARKSKFPGRRTKKSKPAPVVIEPHPTNPDSFERVINVRSCPLCHRPRLNSKAEVDIITHLAVCASSDWNRVDRIVVGNFVTASQAQRKWYTKMISKVSSGNYKIGANSANIIVQNRITGQLEEEKMQVYVRLGIRLLYKGAKGRMEGGRARRLLKSLSIKQGIKYDSPESVRDIPTFIQFHRLNVDEILDPLDSFKTFNEFFYRKLKPTARPLEAPDDPYRLVSAADCRFMSFETVNEATRLWIKGREFTVQRLLGDAYKDHADKYVGGSLCIFRLAPQDYHRFHSPVDGVVGNMTYIAGEYYTVNPQAVRTTLDVYGENARKIVPIDSPQFGRVMAVCVGAMMVGSILITVEEGQSIKRGQEFGYFAFGGSTIVVLFEKGKVNWDEDLLINSRASLETLVRVGMGIGHGRSSV